MEQSMAPQDYPHGTEEHPTSPFDPSGYMDMGTLPSAGGVEHPAGSFDPNIDDMGHPTPPFDPSSYMEIGSLPYDETGRSNPPFDPSRYMQMGSLPYDDEVRRSTTPFDPSMYMQNGIHGNGDFGKYTVNHISISHATCKRRIYPISMLTAKFYPYSITSVKPTALFIPDEY